MYAIYFSGQFLCSRPGWGPTFTAFSQDARSFKTEDEARRYISRNLDGMGCKVVYL